ncbi:superfamily I DNA/RNA helicase [Microbacteriaceae bacterium MWH-Ta3]|nr:superfamily I DNA/RNA helicase [Microbacteriaceae bacterium MWH-Ta3]
MTEPSPGVELDDSQRAVLDAASAGNVRVVGAPGSGKTVLVGELVARHAQKFGADSVRVLVPARRAASRLRDDLALRIGVPTRGPLARSVSSFAHQVVGASVDAGTEIRLIAGGQHDALFAQFLAGEIEDGTSGYWPDSLGHDVRDLREFRSQLRDLAARCADEGIDFATLDELGRRHGRPEWSASARFLGMVQEFLGASHENQLDPSELLIRARHTVETASGEAVHALVQGVTLLVVDDAQDLSPLQWALIEACAARGIRVVALGNPDVATASFRGGDSTDFTHSLTASGVTQVVLSSSYRGAGDAWTALASQVTGRIGVSGEVSQHRNVTHRGTETRVVTHEARSAVAQYDAIARFIRSQHQDGVEFDRMAVVVRSGSQAEAIVSHLVTANLPAYSETTGRPLRDHAAVRDLLTIVGMGIGMPSLALSTDTVDALLTGPFVRMDSLALRALKRRLRSDEMARIAADPRLQGTPARPARELLVNALNDPTVVDDLPASLSRRVLVLAHLLADLRAHASEPIDELLWRVWQASGLERLWLTRTQQSGSIGIDAHRSLDAILALFTAASTTLDSTPDESAAVFIDRMLQQHVPDDTLSPRATGGSVVVCTPAATVGREFDTVIIAGLIDGVWPNLRPRGSLLGNTELAAAVKQYRTGEPAPVLDARATLIHDELRLFLLALSRATNAVLLTTVAGDDETPSPLFRIAQTISTALDDAATTTYTDMQLVAHLRRVIIDTTATPELRESAARGLAALAEAGIPGASPREWLGLRTVSTTDPLFRDQPVPVSPSKMKDVAESSVDWFVDRVAGTEKHIAMSLGSIIHKAMEIAEEPTVDALMAVVDARWNELEFEAPWVSAREKRNARFLVDGVVAYLQFLDADGSKLVAAEAPFRLNLGGDSPDHGEPSDIQAVINGIVDRIEISNDGAVKITDLKTGRYDSKRVGAGDEVLQLTAYQLAYVAGKFDELLDGRVHRSDGAQLLYPKEPVKKRRYRLVEQTPLSDERADNFAAEVLDAARTMAAAEFRGPVDLGDNARGADVKRWVRIPEVCSDDQ